jgi:hypothetical protein
MNRSTRRRALVGTVVLAMVTAVVLLTATSALARTDQVGEGVAEPIVVLTGFLDVPEGLTVDDAVIFNGDATIAGVVDGSVVAFNGDVTVSGRVTNDAVAFNGRVILEPGATVQGNVNSQLSPQIAPDATVGGDVAKNTFRVDSPLMVGRIAFWLLASVASLAFGLLLFGLAPRAAEATAVAGRTKVGASIGFGFMLFVGIPVIGVFALVTLVGALFGVALLTAVVLLYIVAYTAGALALGRFIVKPPRKPVLGFLLGWVILRVLALVPVLGGFLFVAAAVWGFGALLVAGFKAGRASRAEAPPPTEDAGLVPATPPMPPVP